MIAALTTMTIWLALTAIGFAALSALDRRGVRRDIEADLEELQHGMLSPASLRSESLSLADAWSTIPRAMPR